MAASTAVGAVALNGAANNIIEGAENLVKDQKENLSQRQIDLDKIIREERNFKIRLDNKKRETVELESRCRTENDKAKTLKTQIEQLAKIDKFLKDLHTLIARLTMKYEVRYSSPSKLKILIF